MKTKEFFCASPASTAVCSSINHRAVFQPIDRQLHRLPATPRLPVPCSHVDIFPSNTKTPSSDESLPRISTGNRNWIKKPESLRYHRLSSVTPPPTSSPIFKPETETGKVSTDLSSHHFEVVELRVSIHCKGCEAKVRRHISKMQGVTSFSIDMATKKVTVIGDLNPATVLESVSKVKNAQFWRAAPNGLNNDYYGIGK